MTKHEILYTNVGKIRHMQSAIKNQQWYWTVTGRTKNFQPALLVGLGLVVVAGGLAGLNPFLGIACALTLLLLVLIVPRPILIVYGLVFLLPLLGGFARGVGVPFLRLGQTALVMGFLLFMFARPGPQGKSRLTAIDLAFLLYFLAEAVFPALALLYRGEHLSLNDASNIYGVSPLQTLLGPLQYYLLYRIVVATISSERQIKMMLELSFIASIIVSVIGILEKVVAPVKTFIETYYPPVASDYTIPDFQVRIASTLAHYSGLGAYLAFTIIVALACYAARERLSISPLLLVTTILLSSITLILTGTFAAWIGLAVGAVIVFLLIGRIPKLVVFILVGIALAAIIFQPFLSARLDEQIGTGSAQGLLPASLAFRIQLWESIFLPAIGQHLLFGAGPAPAAFNSWSTEESQYFALLLQGGLLNFFSYLFLIWVAIGACWHHIKSKNRDASHTVAIGLLAILVTISVMNVSGAYFTYAGGTQILWTLLGMIIASRQLKELGRSTTDEPTADDKWLATSTSFHSSPIIPTAATLNGPTAESLVLRAKSWPGSYGLVSHLSESEVDRSEQHRQRFASLLRILDGRFVKDSIVVGAGSMIARVLALLFWMVLARFLSPNDVGFVTYSITLAAIIAIAATASPVSIAHFLAAKRNDEERRDRYFSNGLLGIIILLIISLLVSIPILWLLHGLDPGTILCIVGLAGFYFYFALIRGMDSAWKMGLAYFISNGVQMVSIVVVLGLIGLHSATAALMIYGLTFLTPFALELVRPLALRFRPSLISRTVLLEMARFATPVVISGGFYTLWMGSDILLVENFDPRAIGGYAAAKTLSGAFIYLPAAIATVLMPRVAALGSNNSKRYNAGAVLLALLPTLVGLGLVIIWGHQLIALTFGQRYGDAYLPLIVLSNGMSFFSAYIVLEGFIMGRGRPTFAASAMAIALACTALAGFWLTPRLGSLGASLAFSIGAILATGVMSFSTWRMTRKKEQ